MLGWLSPWGLFESRRRCRVSLLEAYFVPSTADKVGQRKVVAAFLVWELE